MHIAIRVPRHCDFLAFEMDGGLSWYAALKSYNLGEDIAYLYLYQAGKVYGYLHYITVANTTSFAAAQRAPGTICAAACSTLRQPSGLPSTPTSIPLPKGTIQPLHGRS